MFGSGSRSGRLQADVIIDSVAESLFAPKIALGRLHAHVSKQKLNLLKLAARLMAKARTRPLKVVRRNAIKSAP